MLPDARSWHRFAWPWLILLPLLTVADEDDQQRALRLRETGAVLPLAQIVERIQRRHPGRVLEVEMQQEQGRWVYEIELLAADGEVWEVEVDAASGELLERERED